MVLAAVSLGLGLAAFFWVPAFGERSYLGFEQLATGFFQPSSHLGIIWPPIQGSLLFDFRYPWRLGLVTAVLAAAGLAVALRRDGDRQVGIFGGLVVLGSLFLLSPLAAPVWQRAPLLNSFQFPWRILPLTGLATSLLIGFLPGRRTQHDALVGPEASAGTPRARPAVETLHATSLPGSRNRWGGLLVAAILATILILTVLNRYPVRPLDAVDFGAGGIDHMASLAGWRLPPREPGRAVVGGPADNVRILRWETQRIDLEVVSQSPAAVTLHLLWFPGWGATVNARPAPILPTGLNALVGVEVPAGASRVSLAFGDTPLRRATTWVSALSLAVLLAVALTPSLSQRERVERHSLLLGVGVLLVAALLLAPWGRVALGGYRAARLAVEPNRDLGPLRLLRAELSSSPARAGYQELTLYWQSRAAAPALAVLTYAFEAGGAVIASSVEGPVGGSYPTDQWQVGEVVRDRIDLRLDAAPAALKIGMAAEGGTSLGSYWWQIGEPAGPVGIVRPLEVDFAGAVGLVGYALDRRSLRPGEPLTVEMLWQREPGLEAGQELGAFVHLIDPGGKLVAQNDAPLGGGKYPPAHWDEGETGRERRNLVVPAGALPGLYRLQAGLYTYPDLQRVPAAAGQSVLDLGPVAVTSPEVQPGSQATPRQSLAVAFPAASLDLIGYDSNPEAQRLAVSLYWRAAASPSEDLAVFVHLLDAAGRLAAQHDGDPAGGSYPTSLWAPGDLVRDTHYLATSHLPPGEYRLLAGLYRRADLQRLAGSPGRSDGAVDLGPVSIP